MSDREINKRVALIKMWHGGFSPANPPSGLLFIGGALKKRGYEPKILHFTPTEVAAQIDSVVAWDPLYIGFSIITGDPSKAIHDFCLRLKQRLPHVPIVFGGVHPSLEPEQCLKEDYVDYVIINEGETSACLLADALAQNKTVDNIDGLGFKKQGTIVINPFRQFHDLNKVEMDWSLVDVNQYVIPHYANTERVLNGFGASRGCPHNCGFCYNIKFNQRKWRMPAAAKVIQNVTTLAQDHDLGGVIFTDDNFTVNKKWALEILSGLTKNGIKGIHIETRVDYITREFLDELSKCSVEILFLGVESGSNRILDIIDKGFRVEDTIRALDLLKDYSFKAKLSFILGLPSETLSEYRQTLALMARCIEHYDVNFTIGFYLPYPGSPLFDVCVQKGFQKPEHFRDWEILDRWGGSDLFQITWTDGNFLTSREVKRLSVLLSKMVTYSKDKSLFGSMVYRCVKFRFLSSGGYMATLIDAVLFLPNFGMRVLGWLKRKWR